MPPELAIIACMTDNVPPRAERRAEGGASLLSLVERTRCGDAEAFEQLMRLTEQRVAATAWRLLGSREDARDATQETFLRAYKYLKSYRPEQDFHGWLYRVTVNVCRDMLRARRGHAAPVSLDTNEQTDACDALARLTSDADTAAAAVLAQQRAIIRRALDTLPERERAALVLRDLEGLSTEEVARLLRTRPATVRSQLCAARTKIKRYCARLLNERRAGKDER